MNVITSSFFDSNSFIGKIQVENKTKNFLVKALFKSFFSSQETEVKNPRILFQKKSKTDFFYIESSSKEICETFLRRLKFSTIYIEMIPCNKKLEKVFNEKSSYQNLKINDIVIFKSGTKKEILGVIKMTKNDFAEVNFLKKNQDFYLNNFQSFKENRKGLLEKANNLLKTIKRDQLHRFTGQVKKFYKKKEKIFQQSQQNTCSNSENFFQPQDILILNPGKTVMMVISFSGNILKLLANDGSNQISNLEELERRLEKKNPRSSEGFDREKNVILVGDYCKILSGKNKNNILEVLFIQNNSLFLKKLENRLPEELKFTVSSGVDVKIVNESEYCNKNQDEALKSIVKIKKGIFKGYEGRILQMGKTEIEIELKANGKLIKIPKEHIQP